MSAQAWVALVALMISVATLLLQVGFWAGKWRAESSSTKAQLEALRIRAKDIERAYTKYTKRRFVPRFLDDEDRAYLRQIDNGEENGEA